MTKRVNAVDLTNAADWLRAKECFGAEAETMKRVADWLDREAYRRCATAEARRAASTAKRT